MASYTTQEFHTGERAEAVSLKNLDQMETALDNFDAALVSVVSELGSAQSAITAAQADITALQARIVSETVNVDASAGGSAQTAACTTVPVSAVLLNVEAKVVTPFDGTSTATFEVGISGNTDAYIDPSDFDPSAAADTVAGSALGTNNDIKYPQYIGSETALIATWTNAGGTPAAGSIDVTTQYMTVSGD